MLCPTEWKRMEFEVFVLDSEHNITAATPRAVASLAEHLDDHHDQGRRLPGIVTRWLEREGTRPPCDTALGLSAGGPSVVAETQRVIVTGRVFHGRDLDVLLLEIRRRTQPATHLQSLIDLGVSRREAEVLSWVIEGKRNCEIGTILGVSPRTVQQHLFRAFQKLGVETRTAAAVKILNALGPTERATDERSDAA
jgi:DNA-binding CsgD family transcriptional regulator